MGDVWKLAAQRSSEFDQAATDYDRFRPRYPEGLFDDIMVLGELDVGATAIEIGAGTGIATGPLADRGLDLTAVEPSAAMAAIGQCRLGDKVRWVVEGYESWVSPTQVDLIASFNAWHWIEPTRGVERAASDLKPGGSIALVWTEVMAWGDDAFEEGLAKAFGAPWPKKLEGVLNSRASIEIDGRFGPFVERRHRFERVLDAATFVAVTRTYGGEHSAERDDVLTALVDQVGGTVTKVEEAVLFIARRT